MSSMELIKKLRDTTGSGIVDCKKALSENNNDIDASVKWLREKGILKAQKKQDRETNEGVVSFYNNLSNTDFTVCKIKCETDFVAKNNDFLNFAESLSKAIHENKNLNMEGTDKDLANLIVNERFKNFLPETELLLIYAARHEHISNLILPLLKTKNIICDRFVHSTICYQIQMKKINIRKLSLFNISKPVPNQYLRI